MIVGLFLFFSFFVVVFFDGLDVCCDNYLPCQSKALVLNLSFLWFLSDDNIFSNDKPVVWCLFHS